MRGGRWLLIGAVVGVAVALGGVPYFAGAARQLADTALAVVASGGHRVVRAVARRGVPQRVVLGLTGVVAVLAPGVTAWLLVAAARGSLRLRSVIAVLIVALGAASFAYHPNGVAAGVLLFALVAAGLAVVATGPLVAAPLAAAAGLIGGTEVPSLVLRARIRPPAADDLHQALFASPGSPLPLRVVLVVVAIVPFLLALRGVLRR
jgi:hypothetical protein